MFIIILVTEDLVLLIDFVLKFVLLYWIFERYLYKKIVEKQKFSQISVSQFVLCCHGISLQLRFSACNAIWNGM